MTDDLFRERVVHKLLERQAAKYGDKTFMYFRDKEFSFLDLERGACRVASGFQGLGIGKDDKVAIIMNNCPEYIFLQFGLSKLGVVQAPINTAHKGNVLAHMLNLADSRVVVVGIQYLDRIEKVLGNTPKLETVVVFHDAHVDESGFDGIRARITKLGKQVKDLSQLVDNDGFYQPVDVVWSDPFAITYTSGTTGPSKGAVTPHNLPLRSVRMLCEAAEITEDDCFYNTLPLFHSSGQHMSTSAALMAGARMVLAERFSTSKFWEDVWRYRCTEFTYIGSMLGMLFSEEPRPDDADNPLRVLMGAGAPKAIFEAFEKRFGVRIVETYGQSEMGLPLNCTIRERKPGSCGKIPRDFVGKVVDANGVEVGPDTSGELLIRNIEPYAVMLGYYGMPDETTEAWRDLWLHTGDYLYYDADGYFFFADRKKDALRRRGENVSSYEVEMVVNSNPAVQESAVVVAKSPIGEEEVMVCLVLKPSRTLTPMELLAYCEERMAYFMVPRYVRFMEVLPKTATQRVEKYRLREEGITPDTWDRESAGYRLKR